MALPFLYETDFLFVVDKPAGWLTTPARSASDPRPCLGRELQTQMGQAIFPVHRLDFEVSGLTLWAKDGDSHRRAQRWFELSLVRKSYHAYSLAGTAPPREFAEWESRLVRGKKRAFEADYGKPSRTLARVLAVEDELWKWELLAITGRPHQLRYEMFKHGSPILGDWLYGALRQPVENWIALRAVELNLAQLSVDERLGLPDICRGPDLALPERLTGVGTNRHNPHES